MENAIAPDIDPNESNYAHCRVEEILPIKPEAFFDWYFAQEPESIMLGTLVVSSIVKTLPIQGPTFGEVGSARSFVFKDKTVASEVVVAADLPNSYSYQPYAYNNPMCMLADYAKSTMRVEADGENTRVIWDYAFHARSKMAIPFVKMFVSLDWKRNLENGLKVIKAHLEQHGTATNIHDVVEMKMSA